MPLTDEDRRTIETIADILTGCTDLLFITGAGISADSGLPTYRGIGGLYNGQVTDEGIPIEMALAGEMMHERPEITWKYIHRIEQSCRGATFNRGHEVIAEMERHFKRVWVLTQNVDGFHRAAGSDNVIDVHGDVHDLRCTQCRYRRTVENYHGLQIPPRCPDCGAVIRPDVVLFGELLPFDKYQALTRELHTGFDIVFSVGTTSVFPYIAQPVLDAKRRGKVTVEINPGTTEVTAFIDIKIPAGAAETLDALWQQYCTKHAANEER